MKRALPVLTGDCNRCGLCCEVKAKSGESYRCEHLEVYGIIGEPEATMCGKRSSRYDMMPIRLVDQNGFKTVFAAYCGLGSPLEIARIITFIGKGCSLQLAEN